MNKPTSGGGKKDGIGMTVYKKTVTGVKPPASKPKPVTVNKSTPTPVKKSTPARTAVTSTTTVKKSAPAKPAATRNLNQNLTKKQVTVRGDGAMNKTTVSYKSGERPPADTLYQSTSGKTIKPSEVMRRPKKR